MIDEKHDEIRRSVGLLPLYGLAGSSGLRMIGEWGWSDGVLSTAGLAYGLPTGTGPWVEIVTTAGPAEELVANRRTAIALAVEPPRDSETFQRVVDAVTAEQPGEVTIEVDGVGKTFRYWPQQPVGREGGAGWLAALDEVPGLVVAASRLEPHEVGLVAVADVEPYLAATKEYLLAEYDTAPPLDQP